MISHLHIENIAVVKSADVLFSQGFNVLTGETGAGKSIIISAINALFGGRIGKDKIRDGCKSLVVSATLNNLDKKPKEIIQDMGYLDEENEITADRQLFLY